MDGYFGPDALAMQALGSTDSLQVRAVARADYKLDLRHRKLFSLVEISAKCCADAYTVTGQQRCAAGHPAGHKAASRNTRSVFVRCQAQCKAELPAVQQHVTSLSKQSALLCQLPLPAAIAFALSADESMNKPCTGR